LVVAQNSSKLIPVGDRTHVWWHRLHRPSQPGCTIWSQLAVGHKAKPNTMSSARGANT
jgi:hypothetical protein